MNYEETLSWLFEQLPMYQRVGKAAYKADLGNSISLLKAIGNPEKDIKSIHIAGTNGKGSVSHIIASVLQEAGFKVGLYTSPHLKDFRERIKVQGKMIPEEDVISFVSRYKQVFNEIGSSFFEMTVGIAFTHFKEQKVDFAVVETGMGGRLDTTNLCHPLISVITNIGFDHTTFLGNTIEKIAHEKAGIIKKDIPVVIGKHHNYSDKVFVSISAELNASLQFSEDIIDLRPIHQKDQHNNYFDVWYNNELILENLASPLLGNYQVENIKTAISTLLTLKNNSALNFNFDDINRGIQNIVRNTGFFGRWQIIDKNPLTITDTGHNIDGIKFIVTQLRSMHYDNLHIVFGMVDDKNTFEILALLPKRAKYYFCKPDVPRGLDENKLLETAFKAGLVGKTYASVNRALSSAKNNCKTNDMVFVGGSTFVVAEVV